MSKPFSSSVSVTFDRNFLCLLAIKEARKNQHLKKKKVRARIEYDEHQAFSGITVFTTSGKGIAE